MLAKFSWVKSEGTICSAPAIQANSQQTINLERCFGGCSKDQQSNKGVGFYQILLANFCRIKKQLF